MLLKWLLFSIIVIVVLSRTPLSRWLKLGRLPGDIDIPLKRFRLRLPLASTALLFVVVWLLTHIKI